VSDNILAEHPDADLRVYAVWVPALATDSRSDWDPSVLADPRVRHFWDGEYAVGYDLGPRIGEPSALVYDVYAVYDADARWGDPPAGAGRTVIGESEQLRSELEPLLG
jgi:hypothetical protein